MSTFLVPKHLIFVPFAAGCKEASICAPPSSYSPSMAGLDSTTGALCLSTLTWRASCVATRNRQLPSDCDGHF